MACIQGYTEVVKLLLEYKADVNVTDENELTPLCNASIPGHTEIVKLLLEHGVANVDHTDKDNDTPLGMACVKGSTQVVELLLKHGANVNHINKQIRTPLVMACIAGHTEIVELLLEHGADFNVADDDNDAPLGIACHQGHTEIVELLLKHGADLSHTNTKECTPFAMACIGGSKEAVELLLKKGGVDVNVTDGLKNTPLGTACLRGYTQVAELLLKHGVANINHTNIQKRTPLGMACIEGYTEVVKLLLEYKADVNVTDENEVRDTPLGMACVKGCKEVVELLLKHGAKVNHTNINGHTPLVMACKRGRKEVVELLLKQDGVDVNATDERNNTPLGIACIKGHTEIVKLLLKQDKNNIKNTNTKTPTGIPLCMARAKGQPKRVDINHKNAENRTPLGSACHEGRTEIVKLLLEQDGVNVNATDKDSCTALQIAFMKQHTEIFELLLKHKGVDVNVTDKDNRTPLGIACHEGRTEIVKLLLEQDRVCVNATDKDSHTALQIAFEKQPQKQHTEIVELLLKHKGVDVNVTDKDNLTILHSACERGHTETVELLMKREDIDVTKCNKDGLNALDIAVERGKKDAAMAIVKSDKWKDALRNYKVEDTSDKSFDKKKGGRFRRMWCCNRKGNREANKQFITPMRRLIKKMPDVAKVVFENCCTEDNPPDHPDHEITFNYEFLDDFDLNHMTTKNWHPPLEYSSENHCLNILADSPSADLLKHPLAATLLDQKWNKIGRIVYYTNLFFYFLFVILLTSFALTVHPPNSNICMEVFGNDNETSIDCFTEERFVSQIYIPIASICLIVYSAILIIREVFQLVLFRKEYLTSPVNYIEVLLFIFTIIFSSVRSNQCYCTHLWQWQVGVIAVFLSWITLIFSIRKLPVVGIYVVMFIKIFNNFIKVVVLALLLISAFAVPFYMMFYDPQDRAEGIRTPFITPWRTTVKAITMTVGELDMDSLLRQNNQVNAPDVQYPVVSFSLIIVFVILMPILFLNLLIGLAVGDTDEIQKSADTYRLTLR
ncbi:PREDICTED: ankyrin repeat domain-containing protein 50-like, partial [Amphimedon queenslandica]|uniref:Ion transport domain-containing protein n=1 Tax=Amphimedon queenslandica TaxID=400682 RepID=A0AAN0JSD9_AMPQE